MEFKEKSRRDFIKNLSVTGSLAFLAATPWIKTLADTTQAGSNATNKVRIAFIGTGSRGMELMRNFFPSLKKNNVEIAAICDNYAPNLKLAVEICAGFNFKPRTYVDYKQLIEKEKPDGVIIATPLIEHAHITIDCLTAGIHVFCEKCMARTIEDIRSMYQAHLSTGKILHIGHQRLFNPIYLDGVNRIHNGEIGQIGQIRAYWHRNNNWRRPIPDPSLEKKINWRLYKESSAGLLTELMSHQLHVANWALGMNPVSVMGTASNVFWKDGRTVPDNIAVIFTYPNGVNCIYDSMISNKKYGLEEQILGHKGTIEFEVNRIYSEEIPAAPGIRQMVNDIEHGIFDHIKVGGSSWVPETAVQYKGEKIQPEEIYSDTALQLDGFVGFIREGKIPENLIKGAYYGSIWTILAETAINSGQKVTIPNDYIF